MDTGRLGLDTGDQLEVVSRPVPLATMAVTRDPGELYLLRHTAGDDAVSFVERVDPRTLDEVHRSPDLAGGPTWPGSIAAHANGSLYVVFGNHAHRLDPDLSVRAGATLPRRPPLQRIRGPPRRSSGHQGLRRGTAGYPGPGRGSPGL